MINVKSGTQTFSDAIQSVRPAHNTKQAISPGDHSKFFGDQNLGEVLNKVADPNWVDPAKMRKVGDDTLDKEAFLKLFLAQLKNQDPTNPMESHELAAQLAQFTSLETLNNIDTGIEKLGKNDNVNFDGSALGLIGKNVKGDSSKMVRTDLEQAHSVNFKLPEAAVHLKATVRSSTGEVVRELEFNNLKKGDNKVSWNGNFENGSAAPLGEYIVSLEGKSNQGKKIMPITQFSGTVTGVKFTSSGPVVMLGDQSVVLKDVTSISLPGAQVDKKMPAAKALNIKKPQVGTLNSNVGSGLKDIGMSRGLVEQVKKDTGKNMGIL